MIRLDRHHVRQKLLILFETIINNITRWLHSKHHKNNNNGKVFYQRGQVQKRDSDRQFPSDHSVLPTQTCVQAAPCLSALLSNHFTFTTENNDHNLG